MNRLSVLGPKVKVCPRIPQSAVLPIPSVEKPHFFELNRRILQPGRLTKRHLSVFDLTVLTNKKKRPGSCSRRPQVSLLNMFLKITLLL